MGIIGYQSRVHITQVLPCKDHDVYIDSEANYRKSIYNSWLYCPFGDNLTFGVEFGINNKFSWNFFLCSQSEEKAKELGKALLFSLQERYKGLDGIISVFPLYSNYLEIKRPLYEINFRSLSNSTMLRHEFLKKFICYYKAPGRIIDLNMYILWKKDDLSRSPDPYRYMIKIFVTLNDYQQNSAEIKAVLRYLVSNLSVLPYYEVKFSQVSPSKWKNILTNNVFPNKSKLGIGPHQSVPRELLPTFISPHQLDFTIPEDFPLPKPPILETHNMNNLAISKKDKNYVWFGNIMIDGILSKEIAAFEIDSLNGHINIFGKTNTGKSTLIKIILHQLHKKRPNIGILIINLVKSDLKLDFPMAEVYTFPSERLKVPYIVLGNRLKKSITGTSNVIAACLGLKYVAPILISETLQKCYANYKEFPYRISEFIACVQDNIKAQPWDPDTTKTISTAFTRRANELFEDHELQKTLNIDKKALYQPPEWFLKFKEGGFILLDLTECDTTEQHLLTMLIFQMIETLLPFIDSNELRYLVSLDEAHRVGGKSRDNDPESVEFIMKNRINSHFSKTIEECRAKGLGIMIGEQKPYLLHDSVIDSARIKVLFCLGYPNNEIFTGSLNEREMLLTLDDRYALVINKKERYLCRTTEEKDFGIHSINS